MIDNGETVGLADGIIDDISHVLSLPIFSHYERK